MSLAERYKNSLYAHNECDRYWIDPQMMIGGSILGREDWSHLVRDFTIGAEITVECEHSDADRGIPEGQLIELPVADDAQPKPSSWFLAGVGFAANWMGPGQQKLYVHCQMGGSRSPAMGYAILRVCRGLTADQALARIREDKPGYGTSPHAMSYLFSAEATITWMIAAGLARTSVK